MRIDLSLKHGAAKALGQVVCPAAYKIAATPLQLNKLFDQHDGNSHQQEQK